MEEYSQPQSMGSPGELTSPINGAAFRRLLNQSEPYDASVIYPTGSVRFGQPKLFMVLDAPADAVNLDIQDFALAEVERFGKTSGLMSLAKLLREDELPAIVSEVTSYLNERFVATGRTCTAVTALYRDGFLCFGIVGDAALLLARRLSDSQVVIESWCPGRDLPRIVSEGTQPRGHGEEFEQAGDTSSDPDGVPRFLGLRRSSFSRIWTRHLQPGDLVFLSSDGLIDQIGGNLNDLRCVLEDVPANSWSKPSVIRESIETHILGEPVDDICFLVLSEVAGYGALAKQAECEARLKAVDEAHAAEERLRDVESSIATVTSLHGRLNELFVAVDRFARDLHALSESMTEQQPLMAKFEELGRKQSRVEEYTHNIRDILARYETMIASIEPRLRDTFIDHQRMQAENLVLRLRRIESALSSLENSTVATSDPGNLPRQWKQSAVPHSHRQPNVNSPIEQTPRESKPKSAPKPSSDHPDTPHEGPIGDNWHSRFASLTKSHRVWAIVIAFVLLLCLALIMFHKLSTPHEIYDLDSSSLLGKESLYALSIEAPREFI